MVMDRDPRSSRCRSNHEVMPKEARTRPQLEGVASADRVLTVLTAFRRGDDALELAELTRRTSLVKSTIMRLCISLEKFDLIERLDDGRYRLGGESARKFWSGSPPSRWRRPRSTSAAVISGFACSGQTRRCRFG
jgi:hypothetical protein